MGMVDGVRQEDKIGSGGPFKREEVVGAAATPKKRED